MARLVTAMVHALPAPPEGAGIPNEIVYIPEGTHAITAKVDGKVQTIPVSMRPEKGVAVAAQFQSDLERNQKANVRPWFDFEHKRGAASALPQSFRYEPGRGVMCAVEWTGAGKTAVQGRDFSYFSPEFLNGDDDVPAGLPDRGPLGALVNEPAFREIPRIAASDESNNQKKVMSLLILATVGLLSADEAARENATELATSRVQAMKGDSSKIADLDAKIKALQAERDKLDNEAQEAKVKAADASKSRAESLVAAAAADGRIAPKDDKTKGFYVRLITAGDAEAEEALASLPKTGADLTSKIVKAADTGDGKEVLTGLQLVQAAFEEENKTIGIA